MRCSPSLLAAGAVVILAAPILTSARGGAVDVNSSTDLRADVSAVLGDPTKPADSKESHDSGSLGKPNVTASAAASVPIETATFSGSGASEAHLTTDGNGFVLAGKSAASLAGASTLAGEVRSSAEIDLPFTIADGFKASPSLNVTIQQMVLRDEKVSVLLTNDAGEEVVAKTFDNSFGGTLGSVGAGKYQLQIDTGSIATAKGVANEAGNANFDLTVSATPSGGTSIPLPTSLWLGGTALTIAFIARRWLQRRALNAIVQRFATSIRSQGTPSRAAASSLRPDRLAPYRPATCLPGQVRDRSSPSALSQSWHW